MKKTMITILAMVFVVGSMTACTKREQRYTLAGGVIGAGTGAALAGNAGTGALVGAGTGAGVGYLLSRDQ